MNERLKIQPDHNRKPDEEAVRPNGNKVELFVHENDGNFTVQGRSPGGNVEFSLSVTGSREAAFNNAGIALGDTRLSKKYSTTVLSGSKSQEPEEDTDFDPL